MMRLHHGQLPVFAALALVFSGCAGGKQVEYDRLVRKKDELCGEVSRLADERARQSARMDKLREQLGAAARLDAEGKLEEMRGTLGEMEQELAAATADHDALKVALDTLTTR